MRLGGPIGPFSTSYRTSRLLSCAMTTPMVLCFFEPLFFPLPTAAPSRFAFDYAHPSVRVPVIRLPPGTHHAMPDVRTKPIWPSLYLFNPKHIAILRVQVMFSGRLVSVFSPSRVLAPLLPAYPYLTILLRCLLPNTAPSGCTSIHLKDDGHDSTSPMQPLFALSPSHQFPGIRVYVVYVPFRSTKVSTFSSEIVGTRGYLPKT